MIIPPIKRRLDKNSRILIDPGHSLKTVGASGQNGITEYACNLLQADTLKTYLTKFNFVVETIDTPTDDLSSIGAKAANYDLFISLHLNAYNQRKNYTCVKVDRRYVPPKHYNAQFASACALKVSRRLQIPCYHGGEYPIGVMPDTLRVLSAAHKVGCPLAFLFEAFFIDYYVDMKDITTNINISMRELAITIKEFL